MSICFPFCYFDLYCIHQHFYVVIEQLAECRDRITAVEYSIFEKSKTENEENIFSSNKYVKYYLKFDESQLMTEKSQLMTKESQLMTKESQLMTKESQLIADKSLSQTGNIINYVDYVLC